MDSQKIGQTIRLLRQQKNFTQKQLAQLLFISDKAVSKWERGAGCPDISLLGQLCEILAVDMSKLLGGDLTPNDAVGGNMKNTQYYVCSVCQSICLCTGKSEVSCCGKKLTAVTPQKATEEQRLLVENVEDQWYITSQHPMTKEHYISFVAFATGAELQLIKQYPEWNLSLRIHKRGHGMLLWYCVEHGLFYQLV